MAASQTDNVSQTVTQSVSDWVSTADTATTLSERDRPLVKLEQDVAMTQFDSANPMHVLRLKRIMHYLSEARTYDQQNWQYNRDDAVERATNILRHHQVKTGQGQHVI
ncbi:hypothetical protein GCM10011338_03400 [Alteromonas lipolytica]|nr:hypothetical protein GCM10011338_03400 [Alteromonas lipolytica]